MLSTLMGSKLRAKVLGWLLMHPDGRYFVRQLEAILKEDSTNLSRELSRLAQCGILRCQSEGRQKYYQANKDCPVFVELSALVRKTVGLADVLHEALKPVAGRIRIAFVYGSQASGQATEQSDVDVLIVGEITFAQTVSALLPAQESLGREVNPSVYPAAEFLDKLAQGHHFLTRVMNGPKLFLIGSEHDLAGLVQDRLGGRTSSQS